MDPSPQPSPLRKGRGSFRRGRRDDLVNRVRTFLILGRVSNLPTVWSNCLAGGWLALGMVCLFCAGKVAGELGIALAFCIILYDAIHKLIDFAPVLMGICRFFLYVIAASTGIHGVTGASVWCGLALGAYIVGLSYVARRESRRDVLRYWPLGLLAAPVVLAIIMDVNEYREGALLLSAVLGLWSLRCLRHTLWAEERDIGQTVSGLLAGIVFVDWLAVADAPNNAALVFVVLFLLALFSQKVVPAT